MAPPDSPAFVPPSYAKTQENLIKRVHFLYKAFYGPWPLLRYIYFSISHIRTSRLLPGDPLEAFSFINFSHQFYYLEWTFTSWGCSLIPPDLSQPSLHLPQWRIIVHADHSSSFFHYSARKRELQDKLMDILGHLKSGLRKMHQIL